MQAFLGAVGAILMLGSGAAAEEIRVTCEVSGIRSKYFQPTEIVLHLRAGRTQVDVEDSLQRKFWTSPIPGTIETSNAVRATYVWILPWVERDPQLTYSISAPDSITQRLTIRPGGEGALVTIVPGQAPNRIREYRASALCREER
jgi:hypothetical protein